MPAQTPDRGFPYPLPTEPVAEGASAIRALAESLDVAPMIDSFAVQVWSGSVGGADQWYRPPINRAWSGPGILVDTDGYCTAPGIMRAPGPGVYVALLHAWQYTSSTVSKWMFARHDGGLVGATGGVNLSQGSDVSHPLGLSVIGMTSFAAAGEYLDVGGWSTAGGGWYFEEGIFRLAAPASMFDLPSPGVQPIEPWPLVPDPPHPPGPEPKT